MRRSKDDRGVECVDDRCGLGVLGQHASSGGRRMADLPASATPGNRRHLVSDRSISTHGLNRSRGRRPSGARARWIGVGISRMARLVSRSWGSETSCETGAIAMTDKPISPLRQRMIEDMTARHFAEKAQKDYIRGETIPPRRSRDPRLAPSASTEIAGRRRRTRDRSSASRHRR